MSPPIAIILAMLAQVPGHFEQDGVRIEVEIKSHLYTWTVKNIDAPPITRLEMDQYGSTEQMAPEGWELEIKGPRYRAWTERARYAIRPGDSKVFEARFKSTGAVLGLVPVELGFDGTDETLVLEGVWSPTPKRRSMVVLVAVVVAGLAATHTVILERRARRIAAPARPDAG